MRLKGWQARRAAPNEALLFFNCPICARASKWPRSLMVREAPTCLGCGSSVRLREVVAAISDAILGTDQPAISWPIRKDIKGVGFSDALVYARYLERATDYENTWYHLEDSVDITDLSSLGGRTFDFAVCSDVLEHIRRPVQVAFDNLFHILRPGGTLVLNFPLRDGETREHFPELSEMQLAQAGGAWELQGRTPDGAEFSSTDLIFHGGPGTTIEMRVFGRASVERHLTEAGFVDISERSKESPHFGIIHEGTPETIHTAGGSVVGMHAGVWTARRPDTPARQTSSQM